MTKTIIDFKTQYGLNFNGEINIDFFAGGGGASTGFEMGTGMPMDIANNHDFDAISMHEANHPHTKHYTSDVFEVDPIAACKGRPVGHMHLSPDCTHFSQAAGSQPRSKAIRSLAWVAHKWGGKVQPRVITLENVEQIQKWSPLVAKRCKVTRRVVTMERLKCPKTGKKYNRVANPGEIVPVHNQFLVPCEKRKGKNWKHFIEGLRRLGYDVQWQAIKASDYGAPTLRSRLYLIARNDGVPITWPEPSHAEKRGADKKPYRTAAECIDFSNLGRSIFDRPKPLADNTLRRIAKGIQKFVLNDASPFIVPIANYGSGEAVQSAKEPLRTITAWPKGGSFAVATAYMAQMNGGFNTTPGHNINKPMSTITNTGSQQQLVTAFLDRQFGNSIGQRCDKSAPTITAGGGGKTALVECSLSKDNEKKALRVAAFLLHYYSNGGQWGDLKKPINTITTRDRIALVTVTIKGESYVIVDICLRMLTPRELYRAQGFPDSYIIDRGHDGRKFTKAQQVKFVGNSVSPQPMAAIARECHKATLLNQKVAS